MFTANPLTGLRTKTVIDAAFGLGEALVAGLVEPDQYVVETATGTITHRTFGRKALAIWGKAEGGTETLPAEAGQRQALADEQIRALADLGRQIANHYHCPQDIK
jgi:pyruvate,water dikinase